MTTLLTPILWAQKSDTLFITIDLRDVCNEKIEIDENTFQFSGTSHLKEYKCVLELFGAVNKEKYTVKKTGFHVAITITKKEEGFWNYLIKDAKNTPANIKKDFNKWCQEDEESDENNMNEGMNNFNGMNFEEMMKNMGDRKAPNLDMEEDEEIQSDEESKVDECLKSESVSS